MLVGSRHLTKGRPASAYASLTLGVRYDDAAEIEAAGGEHGRTKDPHDASAKVDVDNVA